MIRWRAYALVAALTAMAAVAAVALGQTRDPSLTPGPQTSHAAAQPVVAVPNIWTVAEFTSRHAPDLVRMRSMLTW